MAEEKQYWVRTEAGRVFGPHTAATLSRLRSQLDERCEASLDGETFAPGAAFPELASLLAGRPASAPVSRPQGSPITPGRYNAELLRQALGGKVVMPDDPVPERAGAQPVAAEPPRERPVPPTPAPQPAPPPPEKPLALDEEGDLAATSPVRLYATAAQTAATGWLTVEVESGRMLQISFRRGTPDHLSSDDPELSLLRFLLDKGVVSPPQGLQVEEHARKAGTDLVSALFQLQLIPPADAHKLLGDHALFLLDRVLTTWRGRFTFEADAPPPPGAFPLGQKWPLLSEAVRRLDPAALRARLGKRLQRPVVRSGGLGIARVEDLALNAQEARLYAAIDGTRTGEELLKLHDPSATLRLTFLLAELGHLSFVEGREEPTPAPAAAHATADPAGAAEQPTARSMPQRAARTQPALAPRGPPPVMTQVGPVTPRPAPPPTPRPAPAATPRPPPPPTPRPAKAAEVATAPAPTFANPPRGETPEAQLVRLTALLARLEKANHFDALGLERKANAADAKKSFFALAKELHPDTVSDPAHGELRAIKERLFARINEATQVLSDDARRKEYEQELDGKAGAVDVARIFAAEESFQRAEIMIKARKYQEGLALLEAAIKLNADEAEFYAWRGYARFLVAKDRKAAFADAANDCKKAIKMVDRCLPAHLFLGHMQKVTGDAKGAEQSYLRVLQLDPKHVEAQRELRLMGSRKA